MKIKPAEIKLKTMPVTMDVRYSFVRQFLESSAIFVRQAREIESDFTATTIDEPTRCRHRGLVCSTIMQCVAAMETEIDETCVHGPNSHLGGSHINRQAQQFLAPLAEVIDSQNTLSRFSIILHLLKKPTFDKGRPPFQSAALVVRLRNELIHYKSRWGTEMESSKLYRALINLRHTPPPFTDSTMKFFPHRCLSADCAAWALDSVVTFLEAFYSALGVESRFKDHRDCLIP